MSDHYSRSHPRSSTSPGRIPGSGLIADLLDLVWDSFPGCCASCEAECGTAEGEGPFFDDAADLTLEIVKLMRDNGIELDR